MSDDLVSRLRDAHANSTQRIVGSNIFDDAAHALTEARAEIDEVRRTAKHLLIAANIYQDRADAAETELATLRARVREVVGPLSGGVMSTDEQRTIHQLLEAVKP